MLQRLQKAIALRNSIRASDTDALRLIDGSGDGFADLEIDDFAGRWLLQTRAAQSDDLHEIAEAASQLGSSSVCWKSLGDKKESPNWIFGEKIGEPFVVRENGVQYWIDFQAGYSQGIFLDQRDNRLALRQIASGKTVLNTFAYTCAFGLCAALGGAKTVNVDLSKRCLDWGRRNYSLNGLDPAAHDFIYGDAASWMKRFQKKQRRFDVIVLDPPTFSRNEKGDVFTIESGFAALVRAASQILAPGGSILCSTNQRALGFAEFRGLIEDGLDQPRAWKFRSAPMPPDFSGEQYLKTWWLQRFA